MRFWILSVAVLSLVLLHAEEEQRANYVSIFNGNDLAGWEQMGTAEWRVEDGVIVGGQDGDPKRSGILATKKSYENFDLELEFLIDEHGKYNSGVLLRNAPGERKQRGYQVNIGRGAAKEYVGLHMKEWLDKGDKDDSIRKPNAWNKLRIRAVGPHIEVWLNDEQIVDYTDPDPKPEHVAAGVIALQTYGADGHAGWVKFRGVKVAELK